ncbi:hypothetical protein [Anabaena subtropica]|uniref:Secreted protein n=1 Tax=Anabaena subtropica FACHB-260 TaxID=2692884 RepID=A0ABR8CPK6_9NOST|nr:hypothetical protein [Anabaena subtropica]MBD2345127.1 hypothetical protein [Anabaena subtropica FACHB-260]
MQNWVQSTKIGKIFCSIVILSTITYGVTKLIATTAQAQSAPGPMFTPNVNLKVQRTSGTCPQTVGLWWIGLPYEGGAEHTVVADTRAFADTTQLTASNNQRFVEFVSPLRSNYASCVGQVRGQEYAFYNVEFKNKKAYFRVDLRRINAPARLITYKTVARSRPYVRWAIAD